MFEQHGDPLRLESRANEALPCKLAVYDLDGHIVMEEPQFPRHHAAQGIGHALGPRAAAILQHAVMFAAADALLAHLPPIEMAGDRAGQKVVVVGHHHHRHACPAAGHQHRRRKQGIKIMHVDHVGAILAEQLGHLLICGEVVDPAHKGAHLPRQVAVQSLAGAGHQPRLAAVPLHGFGDHADDAGLAAKQGAVIVVDLQHFHEATSIFAPCCPMTLPRRNFR